jgi:hypothetical protein
MNVPLSKELGLFTIAAIPVTHDELCLSKIQFSTEAFTHDRCHESGSATWPPHSKTFNQGEELDWNAGLSNQHNINRNKTCIRLNAVSQSQVVILNVIIFEI